MNLLPDEFAEKHCLSLKPVNDVQPVIVDQTLVQCTGVTDVHIQVGPHQQFSNVNFYAVHGIEYGILSFPLLSQLGTVID